MTKLVVIALALMLCACAGSQSDNAFAYLSPSDLAEKSQQGENGNNDAAFRVATYYQFWKYDRDKAIKWMRISAEHGNPKAKYNLGVILESSSNPSDQKESAYWFTEAAKDGVVAPKK